MIYTSFLTIIALIFGIHFYKSCYPKDYDSIILSISTNIQQNDKLKPYLPFLSSLFYYIVYVYSFFQIAANKTIKFCIPYIQIAVKKIYNITNNNTSINTSINNSNSTSISTSISNSSSISSTSNTNTSNINTISNQPLTTDYDLVLIKSPTNDVIILDSVPDTLDDLKYEVSDIRFFALYLKLHGSENHIIDLYKKDANYYVVGNKLDSEFFKYYLHNVLNVQIDNNIPFEYKLELMDHNIKMVYVNETQSILIEKDGYTIVSVNESLEKTKEEETKEENTELVVEESSSTKGDEVEPKILEAESEPKAEPKADVTKATPKHEEAILDASTVCY